MEDEIEMRRRVIDMSGFDWSNPDVKFDGKYLVLTNNESFTSVPWHIDRDVMTKFANTSVDFRVVSGTVLDLLKVLNITVYNVSGVNFVKTSDFDSIKDKI